VLIFSLILTLPIGFLASFFYLGFNNIPSWNIGIRNLLIIFRNFSSLILFISYFIATLLVISIADKMVFRSLFILHLSVFISGAIFSGGIYLSRSKTHPLTPYPTKIKTGYLTFLKEGVFNQAGDKLIMIERGGNDSYTAYLYNKEENKLVILPEIKIGKKNKNYINIDKLKREAVVTYTQQGKTLTWKIGFKDFYREDNFIRNRLINFYVQHLRVLYNQLKQNFFPQKQLDQTLFILGMLISIVLIAIPASYTLNDGGWGFAGITGAFFILSVLPFFYRGILLLLLKFNIKIQLFHEYSYLFPATIFAATGILLDLFIIVRGSKGRI